MFIAEVIGSVIATRKTESLDGARLRVVQKVSPAGMKTDNYVIAVDVIGANEGEYVLVATGSTARQTDITDERPVDAVIMAIVDTWQTEGQVQYLKNDVGVAS
ncbi:MAG: EutN/CcmL family microcompartment protein [Anaerolineae bacterium]